jgi:hypothetical protein
MHVPQSPSVDTVVIHDAVVAGLAQQLKAENARNERAEMLETPAQRVAYRG